MDGKIFLVAGQKEKNTSTNKVTVFDPAGNNGAGTWTEDYSLALPEHYEGLLAKVIGNTFVITGGGIWYSGNPRKETYSRSIIRNPVYELGFSSGCVKLRADAGSSVKGKALLFTIDGSKNYTTSTNADWLTVTKNAAGTAIQNATDIEFTADARGLAPGQYSGIITAKGSRSGPQYTEASYCVNLTVKGTTVSFKTLEAETAVLNGAKVATNHPDFTGTGFVDYINPYDDYIEWSFNRPEAGAALLRFRYSNGKEPDRPLKLEVNGVAVSSNLSFPTTGAWTKWSITEAAVNLDAGINTVRLTAIGHSGANIDHLAYRSETKAETAQKLAAEENISKSSGLLKAYVYPNPAAGNARLVLKTTSELPVEMEIMDMLGRTYKKMRFLNTNSKNLDFSVEDLTSGIYIIKVKQGNNLKSTRLVIQNRNFR